MRVKVALLADAANVSREGKLNILGIFDTIYTRQFPTTHPQMQLVVRLEAMAEEAGTNIAVEVQLAAPDGRVVLRIPGNVTVQRRETGEAVGVDQVLTFANVLFEVPGRYLYRVVIDGEVAATLPLGVEQLPVAH